jgi:hypothetical protein
MSKDIEMFKDLDKKTYRLVGKYKDAYQYLMKTLLKKIDANLSERHVRSIMAEIQSILKELDDEAYKYCTETLPEYYLLGNNSVDQQVALMSLTSAESGAVLHRKAIEQASNNTYNDLAARTSKMGVQAKKAIRETASELINKQVITGESRKKVVKELKKGLEEKGISSFVDAGGRNWNIARYSDMLLRTKSRILHNDGTQDRLSDYREKYPDNNNFDFIQISSHNAKDWCRYYESTVWSISGQSNIYPSVDRLPNGYSTLHPSCRHIFNPYIPNLRGRGKIISSRFLDRSISSLNKEYYKLVKKAS